MRPGQPETVGIDAARISREILEFLDYDFGFVLERDLAFAENIQIQMHRVPARGRDARTEDVLVNEVTRGSARSLVGRESRLP